MVDEDLEPLITRCPNCATQFRVTESQLAAAGGRVRCGACLTVFEGTEHLILDDEESTFSDGEEADAALDALLDELGTADVSESDPQEALQRQDEPALTQDSPVIYGGFEDERHQEQTDSNPADDAAEADSADTGATVPPDFAPVEKQHEMQPGQAAEEPVVDREPVTEPDAAAEEAASSGVLEADYKAWIRPGTPAIDELVEEVVAAGAAPEVATVDEVPAAAAEDAPSAAGGAFHLSAVEKALEEEGVGTSPISFAPEPRRWWVAGVAVLLAVVLAVQIFYLQLPEWSRDPGTRGFYEAVCGLIGCELPEIRDLDGLRTRNLMVRSHPDLENALIIDAVIVNQAGFEQRFPALELRFTSVGGLLVAARTFQPEEYLAGDMSADDLMPVDTPVRVSLEISDPGKEAVNYTLSFR